MKKLVETTRFSKPLEMRTIFGGTAMERESLMARKFRIHMVGMYYTSFGAEWGSDGRAEGDYLHHFEVVLAGRRQVVLKGQVYDLLPGDLWFLPGNTPVERRCAESCEVIFFKLHCEWLPGVDPLLDWPEREPRRIGRFDPVYWNAWRDPMRSVGMADLLQLRGHLMVWMSQAVPELGAVIENHHRGHTHFSAVFEKIEKNLGADLRLPALASVYGTSPAAFAMAFTRSTGMGPKEYLTRRLNQEAIQWVINTDLKMSVIADKLRFKDEYYFSRFFQKLNGLPPSRYRQNFHNAPGNSKTKPLP